MVRDELTDEQRARLCILEAVIDITDTEIDAGDLVRFGSWVELGSALERAAPGTTVVVSPPPSAPMGMPMRAWEPAVPR